MTNRVKRVTEAPEGEWLNDNSIPMISFHVVHDVPTRVRTHPQIRIPARDKREGDLQTNGSPYSNTNTAFVRTSIRHRTRTHRTARKKSSITARFRLLFPPFLSSPKLRFSKLDSPLTPCHNSMPRTSTFQPNLVFHKMKNRVRVKFIGRRNKERK